MGLSEDSSISEKQNKTKTDTFKQYLPCPLHSAAPLYPEDIYDNQKRHIKGQDLSKKKTHIKNNKII